MKIIGPVDSTENPRSLKRAAVKSIEGLNYSNFKSISNLQNKVFGILAEFKDQEIINEQLVTLKVLNNLKGIFPTYFTVLMIST